MGTMHWSEKQSADSDYSEYGISGSADSIRAVYYMLFQKGKPQHVRITWLGRIVLPLDRNYAGLFSWYSGDIKGNQE